MSTFLKTLFKKLTAENSRNEVKNKELALCDVFVCFGGLTRVDLLTKPLRNTLHHKKSFKVMYKIS